MWSLPKSEGYLHDTEEMKQWLGYAWKIWICLIIGLFSTSLQTLRGKLHETHLVLSYQFSFIKIIKLHAS